MCSMSPSAPRSTCARPRRERALGAARIWVLASLALGPALARAADPPASPAVAASSAVADAAPASAAPKATPAAPQGAPAAPQVDAAELFAQALDAVRRDDMVSTALLCWAYLRQNPGGQSGDKAESASFYLAEALERRGYTHAAVERYVEILAERRAPQLVPRALAALERLARAHQFTEEAIAQAGVLTVAEFEELPPQLTAFVQFRQAVDDLRRGYDGWGQRHISRIREDSPYQPMALYARAVWRLGRGEVDEALADLERVLAHQKTPAETRAKALHSRARVRYERGQFNEAFEDLAQIDLRYESGGEVLLEKAWAKFRARDFRTALGLLHALGAPAYVGRFAPERYLLRSLIFSKYCHFRAAKRSIEQFRQRFQTEIKALRAGERPERVGPLRAAAFERSSNTGAGAVNLLVQALEGERRSIGAVPTWGSDKDPGSLNRALLSLYDLKLRDARFRQERLLQKTATRVAAELMDAEEQMNLLEYEVGLGIYRRIGKEARIAEREARPHIPLVSEQDYYRFDGEYWTDELPDMQFFIEDRCVD